MNPGIVILRDGSALGVLPKPMPCACGRMVVFVANRDGRTRCLECDETYQKTKAAKP